MNISGTDIFSPLTSIMSSFFTSMDNIFDSLIQEEPEIDYRNITTLHLLNNIKVLTAEIFEVLLERGEGRYVTHVTDKMIDVLNSRDWIKPDPSKPRPTSEYAFIMKHKTNILAKSFTKMIAVVDISEMKEIILRYLHPEDLFEMLDTNLYFHMYFSKDFALEEKEIAKELYMSKLMWSFETSSSSDISSLSFRCEPPSPRVSDFP